MDFFSRLPAPLPLYIIQQLDTFEDLDAMIHASPDVYRTFLDYAPAILDSVASNALDPELHNVLYSIVHVRRQPVDPSLTTTLESFRQIYAENLTEIDSRPGLFPRGAGSHVYLALVSTAVNIRRLSALVLAELLRRTSKMRLQHAVSRFIDFASGVLPRTPYTDGWPIGKDIILPQCVSMSDPSWIECYRVQRAMWLVQLALDVRTHAPWLRWSAADIPSNPAASLSGLSRLWPISKLVVWFPLATDAPFVAATLEDVCTAKGLLGRPPTITQMPALVSLERMPLYTKDLGPGCKLEDSPKDDAVGASWSQDRGAAKRPSDGRHIFMQLITNRHVKPTPAIIYKIMGSGLLIWDRKRLCDLGLMDEPGSMAFGVKWWESEDRRPQMSPDEIWYAWCSVGYDDTIRQ